MKINKNLVFSVLILAVIIQVSGAAETKITANGFSAYDPAVEAHFGRSVSIWGNFIAVGANRAWVDSQHWPGAVYFYSRSGSVWSQFQKVFASDSADGDYFGFSVSIDSVYAVISAPWDDDNGLNSGSVYIFKYNGSSWSQINKLTASDGQAGDYFGYSVDIDGDYIVVGTPYASDFGSESGKTYIFYRNQGGTDAWGEQAILYASDAAAGDRYGWSVAIAGDYAIVGAYLKDTGSTSATGAAYVYYRSATWSQQAKLSQSDVDANDYFGEAVDLCENYAIIGASERGELNQGAGSVYVFLRQGTNWTQQQKLTASDSSAGDEFGYAVRIDSNVVIIGAHWDDDNGNASGSAYSFVRTDTTWTQVAKITASDADSLDEFGNSVTIYGDYIVCGAYFDDHTSLKDPGSAYIYKLNAYVNVKVFLEGPYDAVGDTMSTALNDNGYLPLSQPFNSSPWNYGGSESVSSIPAGVVDWVLVELRTGTAADTRVASRAAFLKKDGTIVDLDGTSQVKFLGLLPDNYYIVIRHRNHLAVMSANAVTLSENSSTLYDFTTGTAQYYGADAKQLETGVYGMYTGDASANGQVQTSDKNDYWKSQVGTNGYKSADFNLNGEVQTSDKNDYWKNNVGRGTQVP